MDWEEVKWRLMQGDMRLRPWEIRAMTQGEIALALEQPDGKKRPPRGSTPLNPMAGDLAAYAERIRSLTPRKRLEEMRGA